MAAVHKEHSAVHAGRVLGNLGAGTLGLYDVVALTEELLRMLLHRLFRFSGSKVGYLCLGRYGVKEIDGILNPALQYKFTGEGEEDLGPLSLAAF